MSKATPIYKALYLAALLVGVEKASPQTGFGNQPPITNPNACITQCAATGAPCGQDSDCCTAGNICLSAAADPNTLKATPMCGAPGALGAQCGANHDCADVFICNPLDDTCEPEFCTCEGNPCFPSKDLCLDGGCVPIDMGAGGCGPEPPPVCSPNNCTNCIPPTCPTWQQWDPTSCQCFSYASPIIIDTDGSGFHLTSAAAGVLFDFFGDGKPIQIAWTAEGSTNGWLALDRNGNGKIDSAKELFGNITPQPPSEDPNGFVALAVFDEPANGGNGDGIIDSRDAVWPKLLVWIDANHDGISQPEELHHLDEMGIHSIGLMYTESLRADAYGNRFRYKGHLNPDGGDKVNRVIYDVILTYEE